ncbi:MAG: type II secretion system secretin GspD [Burkholderiales bacterium]
MLRFSLPDSSHTHPLADAATRLLRAGASLALLLAFTFASSLIAAAADDELVTLNFVNADIDAVVKAVSEITGRNFVLDPKIKGTVNIISARPVPKSLVYPTLLSALRLQGVAAVEGNGVTKLVLETEAKMHGTNVGGGGAGDQLTTRVITLRHESAQQMVNVLRPIITPNNTIAAFPGTNALVITDYAENMRRIEKIVASLDQPPAGEPMMVTLKYASALDLVPLLNRLLGAESGTGAAPGQPADPQQRVTLVADPRSNSVMLRSENPARASRVKALIEQLDTPGRPGGNIFIVYLKNAEAARVAQTLRALMTGGSDTPSSGTQPSAIGNTLAGATGSQQPPQGQPQATQASMPSAANPFTGASGNGGQLPGGLTIQADVQNNALIIMGPEPLYNNLRAIIERLDVRRAQVFVEALIVEVAADKAAQFGIQWQFLGGLGRNNGVQGFGGTNFGQPDSGNNIVAGAINLSSLGQGLNAGIVNGTVTIPGIGLVTNLAFLARALEQSVGANILSTPTLLTLDNEEARIIVGQNIPLVTGQYATTGGNSTVQPFQTIERKDIGVLLRVKPQITEGGAIRLVIYQEVSRIDATVSTTTNGLVLSKRAIESSVVVDDTQVAVLGGLIQDSFSDGSDRVPVLGNLPILGALFRYDTRSRQKVNLLIFLKPTVVRTDAQGKAITNERYDYIIKQQLDSRPEYRYFWNDQTAPVLPPIGETPGTIQGATPSNVTQPGAPQPPIPPTWPLGPPIGTPPATLQVPAPTGAPPPGDAPK